MSRDLKAYFATCFELAFKWHGKTQLMLNVAVLLVIGILSNFIDVNWLSQSAPKRTAAVSIGFLAMNMLLVSPFRVYRQHIAELERLKQPIRLSFKNEPPFVERNREKYGGDDRVAFRLDTKRRLGQVLCWVTRVCHIEADGSDGPEMNGISKFLLAFPYGEDSWKPRDISNSEYVVIFLKKNQNLVVFTNAGYRELDGWKNNLPHGKYRFDLEIDSPSLDSAIERALYIHWNGDIDALAIDIR